jgi:tRNA 2-selenouridine synthase
MAHPDVATVADLPAFDAIVDVRSPAEFAEDRIPGAWNCPVLDDAERARVGTMYAQESPFAARKVGAALVARNIANHIETRFADFPRGWRPLVYCWRGGQRSGSMTLVLRQIGWDARQLAGGYRAFRRSVVADLEVLPGQHRFRVICGPTGSGKSRLLRALTSRGAQVLDLEALASHRGSLLGDMPTEPQPTQKAFETSVWAALRGFDPALPVFVEAESKRIGKLRVPETLIHRMRDSTCLRVRSDTAVRVDLLMHEYEHFFATPERLATILDALVPLHGHEVVRQWRRWIEAAEWPTLVRDLLERHYDPAYGRSIASHFAGYANAEELTVTGLDDYDRVAAALAAPAAVHEATA